MGVALAMGRRQADLGQQRADTLGALGGRTHAVNGKPVADLGADTAARIEAGIGTLEDDLHPPPHGPELRRAERAEIGAVHHHPPGAGRDQAEQQPPQCALARSALADEADPLAAGDGEIDRRHRLHRRAPRQEAARCEVAAQPLGLHQRAHASSRHRKQRVWRSGRSSSSGGASRSQTGRRRPQRGAKAQPGGRAWGSGTRPGMGSGSEPSSRGALASRAGGIGMARRGKDLGGGSILHHLAGIHHRHAVGDLGHYRQVVGDEDQCDAPLSSEIGEQFQDLRLHGDIQRRSGLVGDQQYRIVRDRDHHALPHTAGQFMGKGAGATLRIRDADATQECDRLAPGGARRERLMRPERLADLPAHTVDRIETAQRILEHHGDASAAQVSQRRLVEAQQILPLQEDAAACHL
jgi:hypothetical protein